MAVAKGMARHSRHSHVTGNARHVNVSWVEEKPRAVNGGMGSIAKI